MKSEDRQVVARNPKARHDYHILDKWEAGMVLTGPEIKSIRAGKVNLKGGFATVQGGEAWLHGINVSPYQNSGYAPHDPERKRKLLLHRSEIRKIAAATDQRGLTLVPLQLYIRNGVAKVEIGLAQGKKLHDKREDLKKKATQREIERALRTYK